MIASRRIPSTTSSNQYVRLLQSSQHQYGRTAVYRRIEQLSTIPSLHSIPSLYSSNNSVRSFHSSSLLRQQAQKQNQETPQEEVKDPPRTAQETSETKDQAKDETDSKQKDGEEGESKQEKKDAPPPPPHGDKTPWQVFRDTFSTELKASKEWNESTKQLAGEVADLRESEGVKKASEAYDKTFGAAGRGAQTAAKAVGTGAAWTWETPVVQGVRKGVNATGRGIDQVTKPIRETEAFKKVTEAIDDGSSARYGGWAEKEERRARRLARDAKNPYKVENFEENPDAGTNVTLHKDAAWKEAWNKFKEDSKLGAGLRTWRSTYEESENPLISTARSITDRIAGFFAENETAMVIKKLREMDPNFQMEPFLQDMREFVLPELIDAYVKADHETLKLWLSAAQFQVYSALMEQYTKHGLKSDGKVMDIRGVDVLNARLLEPGEIPVLILTARTQEVHCYRNKKTGELAAGTEDRVQQVTYVIGVTRLPEEVNNPETRGWRIIELQKHARDYI